MRFRTEETTKFISPLLGYDKPVALLGSCFSDNMAERLRRDLFEVTVNPFGPLYNPASLCSVLTRIVEAKTYTIEELFQGPDGLWHSFDHNTSFSASTPEESLARINAALNEAHDSLSKAQVLFVTLGTAWVFYHGDDNIVANCHKLPQREFVRRLLSVDQVADYLGQITGLVDCQCVFTVSPIRHLADGLHGNTLSKSVLHLAIEKAGIEYFPAYEMLIDDLRDYRFYAADMKHPSEVAADYIYEKLLGTYASVDTRARIPECRAISARRAHRPIAR